MGTGAFPLVTTGEQAVKGLGGLRAAAALLLAAIAAVGLTAPAAAAPYKGKTEGGSTIRFDRRGNQLKGMRTVVPTVCLETTGGYDSRAGGEIFRPPRAVLGRKVKSKALQPAAMNRGIEATKSYTVEAKRAGKRVKGRLSLSYSFLIPDLYGSKVYVCSGSTTFTAGPR